MTGCLVCRALEAQVRRRAWVVLDLQAPANPAGLVSTNLLASAIGAQCAGA